MTHGTFHDLLIQQHQNHRRGPEKGSRRVFSDFAPATHSAIPYPDLDNDPMTLPNYLLKTLLQHPH